MDRPDTDPSVLEEDLKNLRIINRYFGGVKALQEGVMRLASKVTAEAPLTILDLATGTGDQPIALVKRFRKLGRSVSIIAVDRNPVMLSIARGLASEFPEIEFEQYDLGALPFKESSFDIVTCSLAIHHLSNDDATKLLRKMYGLCRIGFVINDLSRSYLGAATAWLYTRLTTRNPMTLYDSMVSVLRAFTKEEMMGMAADAGIGKVGIVKRPMFRLVTVKEK